METYQTQFSQDTESSNYQIVPDLIGSQQANTPPAPTLENLDNWYNKLHLVLDSANNPSDTTFAISITDDNWVTTQYVQSDQTIGPTLAAEDYQTYSAWGGATGIYIIGLSANSSYRVKVKANQGLFTESPWGPEAVQATDPVTLSFDIDVADSTTGSAVETSPPYAINIGDLTLDSVTTASDAIWIDLGTNAEEGANVYVNSNNSGITSAAVSHTINSVSADLTSASEGYGLQTDSTTQIQNGPITPISPFNQSGNIVGQVTNIYQPIFSTSDNPITSARASILIKTKVNSITPAATDYTATITIIASATF